MTVVNSYWVRQDGSAYYRLELPAMALKKQGYDILYQEAGPGLRDADVLVFSRPNSRLSVDVIKSLAEHGYGIVIDVDDNFSAIRTQHVLYPHAHEVDALVKEACQYATVVTGTTQPIIDEYGYGHGVVIPNYIPESYLSISYQHTHACVWVGWAGSVSSHPNDLQVTEGQAAKAIQDNKASLIYVGPEKQADFVRFCLDYKQSVIPWGWKSIEDYPYVVAAFDIGLAPLETCLFNDSKSWLKCLEYAALGVPFVASSTPQYRSLGVGHIVKYPNEWKRALESLIRNEDQRIEESKLGRERAAEFTIEKHCNEWADVFELAERTRHGR